MTQDAAVCQHCGAPLRGDSYFCGGCGKPVAASEQGQPARKHTMLGVIPGAFAPAPPAPPAAAEPAPAEPAAPAADTASEAPPPGPVQPGERTTDVGLSGPPKGAVGRTMLGLPQRGLGEPDTLHGAAPPPAEGGAKKTPAKTMLGLAGAAPPPGAPAPAETPAAGPAARGAHTMLGTPGLQAPPRPGAEAPAAGPAARGAHTMLGTPGLQAPSPPGEPQPAPAAEPAPRKTDPARTVLGLDDSAEPAETVMKTQRASREAPAPRASAPSQSGGRASASSVAGMRRGPAPAAVALATLSLLAALGLGYMALRGHGPDVHVRVVTDKDGESMLFEVPAAAAGAKLRFGGLEKPLQAGRASFALAPDSLRVGKNAVLYDVVAPDGSIQSGKVTLSVDSRVTLDTAPLRAGKAVVDVVVAALPGSKVWLDGQPVTLDAQGRAVRSDPLQLAAGAGTAEHVVKYRVEPPSGEPAVGELRATIAVTMMQIDRPGAQTVTDHDTIEIAGAADKDGHVTVDGQPVELSAGRFLDHYALPHTGDYAIEVVAMAPGKAPRSVTLQVQRVESLVKAAEAFEVDRSLTYAKIAQNPTIYRGQHVSLEGRIYNASVEGGHSSLQVLVRQCPSGDRCPLWISYPGASELTVDDWVRVLGTVAGEQQFRAESGEVKSVPKVEAVFLLPAKP